MVADGQTQAVSRADVSKGKTDGHQLCLIYSGYDLEWIAAGRATASQNVSEPIDGVVISTRPEVTGQIVQECAEVGVSRVWMHRSFGQGSVSDEATKFCQDHNITVIPGGCPMMFCEPVDFGHKCMRWFLGLTGGLPR